MTLISCPGAEIRGRMKALESRERTDKFHLKSKKTGTKLKFCNMSL